MGDKIVKQNGVWGVLSESGEFSPKREREPRTEDADGCAGVGCLSIVAFWAFFGLIVPALQQFFNFVVNQADIVIYFIPPILLLFGLAILIDRDRRVNAEKLKKREEEERAAQLAKERHEAFVKYWLETTDYENPPSNG